MKWENISYPFGHASGISKEERKLRENLFYSFANFFGFNKMANYCEVGSFERLLYGEKSYNNTKNLSHGYNPEKLPEKDHAYLFKINKTKKIVLVNQPYQFNIDILEKWCNERDLIYVIYDKKYSFYYPNGTEMVLIMSSDTYCDFTRDIPTFPKNDFGYDAARAIRLISLDKVEEKSRKVNTCPEPNSNGWIVPYIVHTNYIVDERLKNKYIKILITYETLAGKRYVEKVLCNHGRVEKKFKGEIVAWQPLPKPYKG